MHRAERQYLNRLGMPDEWIPHVSPVRASQVRMTQSLASYRLSPFSLRLNSPPIAFPVATIGVPSSQPNASERMPPATGPIGQPIGSPFSRSKKQTVSSRAAIRNGLPSVSAPIAMGWLARSWGSAHSCVPRSGSQARRPSGPAETTMGSPLADFSHHHAADPFLVADQRPEKRTAGLG